MVQDLCLTDGLSRTASTSVSASRRPAPAVAYQPDGDAVIINGEAEKVEVASSDSQADGNVEEQATEMSERKTLLIR